jgi:hypothetical protein
MGDAAPQPVPSDAPIIPDVLGHDGPRSRSLWVAAGFSGAALLASCVLLWWGKIDAAQWLEAMKWTTGLGVLGYGGINLGQRGAAVAALHVQQ